LTIESNNGEVWGALGHCYLMIEDLQKAYASYQQALYHLPNPKVMNASFNHIVLWTFVFQEKKSSGCEADLPIRIQIFGMESESYMTDTVPTNTQKSRSRLFLRWTQSLRRATRLDCILVTFFSI